MNRKDIEQLLERFMQGATTEQEETQLADFFRTADDIPAEWADYQTMFALFDVGEPSFSEAEKEAFVSETEKATIAPRLAATHRRTAWAVAASIAVALGVVGWMTMRTPATEPMGAKRLVAKEENTASDDLIASQGVNIGERSKGTGAYPPEEAVATIATNNNKEASPNGERFNQGNESSAFADNQNEYPLIAHTEPEQQAEQAFRSAESTQPRLSDEYNQTVLSIRQRGERLMSRMMANGTTVINERYN